MDKIILQHENGKIIIDTIDTNWCALYLSNGELLGHNSLDNIKEGFINIFSNFDSEEKLGDIDGNPLKQVCLFDEPNSAIYATFHNGIFTFYFQAKDLTILETIELNEKQYDIWKALFKK